MDQTLAAPQLERVHAMADTVLGGASETIRPRSRGQESTHRGEGAIERLQELGSDQGRVEMGETLGQGGMGHVRMARQSSLGRQVAVKTTREDKRSDRNTRKLLREGWVNGALEHPNILPIYDLSIDESGAPVLVMRLVEGSDWQEIVHDPQAIAARYQDEDALEWNLRVLMQVCQAMHYAHDRGIVHRDLKPANVMLGPFGEVYVVDWGIAVSLREDEEGRFPRPEAEGEIVGTPAYMPPEMLAGRMEELGPRTDVYLLGAILYQILVGRPPHKHDSIGTFIESVMHSRPELPENCPEELVQICHRALAADPEERFESAEALRRALQDHLRHRSSTRLSEQGEERLASLRAHLEDEDGDDESGAEAQRLYTEARFAFESAQQQWAANPAVREGAHEAMQIMAWEHIRREELAAAQRLMSEFDQAPTDLHDAVEALRQKLRQRDEERERLEALGRDHDSRFGQRTRWGVIIGMGVMWSALPPAVARLAPAPQAHLEVAAFPALFLVLIVVITLWARESLMSTRFNRRVTGLLVGTFLAQFVLTVGSSLAGAPVAELIPAEFFLWFVAATMFAITLDTRFWPSALGYMVGYLVVAQRYAVMGNSEAYITLALDIAGMTHLFMTSCAAVIWRPRSWFKRLPDEHLRGSG